ncbi:MAG: helicase-related protein [Syntrophorhabdales bacterium]|jgi:HKD family nuclease/superfamily II DNA or RNA helicase
MPTHDIIDNRSEKLIDHLSQILGSCERARFAVGYLFLSGLTSVAKRLLGLEELRLLIGNTTNRETVEMLAEGYRHLDLAAEEVERQLYPKRMEAGRMTQETAGNLRNSVELMDQTDEAQELIAGLIQMIQDKRLKVRVYTKGRLHAKAYICDYGKVFDLFGKEIDRHELGIAVVGSSNLTLAGLTHNTELNVIVQGNQNHHELVRWFDDLWKEAQEFDETLMQELKESWAAAQVRPYDIYMKTLFALVKDRLEGEEEQELLWDDDIFLKLASFQKVAVRQSVQMIRDFGGGFVSDVVGLGKSYIGAAIVKHFERADHARPLVICPAALKDMWDRYNEVYQLNAQVLSMGYLREDDNDGVTRLLKDFRYKDRDFVLVDESHNLRHPDTQRYKVVQTFLSTGRRCCFLTATPRNKSAWDVYHQIKLFHQDDRTDLPIDPPNLKKFFKLIERGEKKLPDLLANILIRRTRNHILRWYGFDAGTHEPIDPSRFQEYLDGKRKAYVLVGVKHQFFPKRQLQTIIYSIEDTYQGLYQQLRGYLGKSQKGKTPKARAGELTYARYGLWHYVHAENRKKEPYVSLQRAGANLRGLMRVLLFKRFESSVYAFQETIRRLLRIHESFLKAIDEGFVPAGEEAQYILYGSDTLEEDDLMDALRSVSQRYDAKDFDTDILRDHIAHDIELLKTIQKLVEPISPEKDAKLRTLKARLADKPLKGAKRLIFTQYADTARYLYANLNPGDRLPDVEVIYSGDKSKARIVGRFAPKANPEYHFAKGEAELMTVVATDVLAEGLNLQDCDNIINYDLHWNPVRLIQRFGRIDRIGSEHALIFAFNFLPEVGIEKTLGLYSTLHNRIQEIHDTIGEDSSILDDTERLNPEAMYAIYEPRGSGPMQLELWDKPADEFLDLNEAEEILRQLRKEDPAEFERIETLRDGIRTARSSPQKGMFVFCQAGRFQQLFLLDDKGAVVSRDIPRVVGAVKCSPDVKAADLPAGYNKAVMAVQRAFAEEVKHREAERKHTLNLTHGQLYALRELRILFETTTEEEIKSNVNILEKAFRGALSGAVKRELNQLRRNAVTGEALYKNLIRIYDQHNLKDVTARRSLEFEVNAIPRIICSEALV